MANDLTEIATRIVAKSAIHLREMCVMPLLVNADFSDEVARAGDTIDVPLPSAVAVSDVTPSHQAPAPASTTLHKVSIPLANWKKAGFYLTDKEMVQILAEQSFLPMQALEAIRALANAVNESVHGEYKGVWGYVGTAGTTPFGAGVGVESATAVRKLLNRQVAPRDFRSAVLNFDAEAQALALPQFSDAEKAGDSRPKTEGEVGRKFGIHWFADDAVRTHVAGTAADGGSHTITVVGTTSAGAMSVTLKSNTGTPTLVAGDILSFAGHDQTYVVGAGVSLDATGVTVAIQPGLKANVAGASQVSVRASHVVNLAFHRDAFALAMRPMIAGTEELPGGGRMYKAMDPQTGIPLRLEVTRQYKQTVWEFDLLWGVKLVRPELAIRLAG
jgi:hypothetical protein